MGARFAHARAARHPSSRSMGRPTTRREFAARDTYAANDDWPTRGAIRRVAKSLATTARRQVNQKAINESLALVG